MEYGTFYMVPNKLNSKKPKKAKMETIGMDN